MVCISNYNYILVYLLNHLFKLSNLILLQLLVVRNGCNLDLALGLWFRWFKWTCKYRHFSIINDLLNLNQINTLQSCCIQLPANYFNDKLRFVTNYIIYTFNGNSCIVYHNFTKLYAHSYEQFLQVN